MSEIETSQQRSGGSDAERRQDGSATRHPLDQSEAARGNVEPSNEAPRPEEMKRTLDTGGRKLEVTEDSGVAAAEAKK